MTIPANAPARGLFASLTAQNLSRSDFVARARMQRAEQAFNNKASFEKARGDFTMLTLSQKGLICTAQSVGELAADLEGRGMKLTEESITWLREYWEEGTRGGNTYTGNVYQAKTEAGSILVRLFKPTQSYDNRQVESLKAYDETGFVKSFNGKWGTATLELGDSPAWRSWEDRGERNSVKPDKDEPAIWAAAVALAKAESAKAGIQAAKVVIDPAMYESSEGRIHVLACELRRAPDNPNQDPPLYWKEGEKYDEAKAKSTVYVVISTSEACDADAREIRNFLRLMGFRVAQFRSSKGIEELPAHEAEADIANEDAARARANAASAEIQIMSLTQLVESGRTQIADLTRQVGDLTGANETLQRQLQAARGKVELEIEAHRLEKETLERQLRTETDRGSRLWGTIGRLQVGIQDAVHLLTHGNNFGNRARSMRDAALRLQKLAEKGTE